MKKFILIREKEFFKVEWMLKLLGERLREKRYLRDV